MVKSERQKEGQPENIMENYYKANGSLGYEF